jgi:hypothetical protein
MAEFSNSGTLSTTGTILATGNRNLTTVLTKVMNLRFNNQLAYSIQLYKYDVATTVTTLIYDLTLAAGDTVTDNMAYALNVGDQLIAYSNIPGTTFYMYGINY